MTSKFAGLKEMRQRRSQQDAQQGLVGESPDLTAVFSLVSASLVSASPVSAPLVSAPVDDAAPTPVPAKKMGRPPGKRSNPEYQQVTVLLHSATYTEARKRLLDERKDVSDLINELLDGWLKV
ncbi:hypothetical protein [Deinococcus sp.]|uniref:hypothetical protein n=1 Tax=Deinococcus sp. TaxID=47478 RepID=UPI0025E6FAF7|nr:hypothetical protein [Deinococcus sp.]